MALHIAFEKSSDTLLKRLVKLLAGPYVHTELIVSQNSIPAIHTAYSAYVGCTFARTFQLDFWFDDQYHDFLSIPVSDDELYRVSKACEACSDSKIPYNIHDMLFCKVPLRAPRERDLFHSPSLFCSQAAVLILRSCLDDAHCLQPVLSSINSRTVTPTELFDLLKPCCDQKQKHQVLC